MKNKIAGHTPGPWGFYAYKNGFIVESEPINAIDLPICHVTEINAISTKLAREEARANAALIAAAPDLLAALENAEASVEMVRCLDAGGAIDTEADNMLDSLQNRIRAAIAKAKGAA